MFDIDRMKVVYEYDKNGVLCGTQILGERDKDTATGRWVYPPNTTPVVPPPTKKGYCLVWKFGVWSYKEYKPNVILPMRAQIDKEYKEAQEKCAKNISLAYLRGDQEAIAGIREDFEEIQQAYNEITTEG